MTVLAQERTGFREIDTSTKTARPRRGWQAVASYILAALLISIPCFWQPHIQANDLSSHLYNAWLVNQVEAGQLKGLYIVPQFTNVLFDHLLSFLLKSGSVVFTERVAVLIAVQIFFWGCFALVSTVARRRAWTIIPFLALLTYGAVFRMGFFNFYISVGMCAWAITLAWRNQLRRRLLAIPLLVLAYTAHLIPCLWAIGVIGYVIVGRRLRPSHRPWLGAAALTGIAGLTLFIYKYVVAAWQPHINFSSFPGVDQVLTYGAKYLVVAGGLFAFWILLLIQRVQMPSFLRDLSFQLWVLSAATCLLMPTIIWLPIYSAALTYIVIRLSLLSAVLLLAVIARVRLGLFENLISIALLALYFSFAYVDERAINSVEQDVAKVLATLPAGTRVVATLKDSQLYVPALEHVLDRECIGRCFDFGDYEPATTQFRLRATEGNAYVLTDIGDLSQFEHGEHVWQRQDIELIRLLPCKDGRHVCTAPVKPGDRLVKQQIVSVPKWWVETSRNGS
jgi:hypothetical protein